MTVSKFFKEAAHSFANKVVNNIDATEIISKVAVGLSQFYNRLQSK